MTHIRRLPIVIAAVTLAWATAAFSASSPTDAEHEQHHPGQDAKRTAKTPTRAAAQGAAPQATGNQDLDAHIAHLRAIRERLSRADTPDERLALLEERNMVVREVMAIMHKDMTNMKMQGADKGQPSPAQLKMCHEMMAQHMAIMEEVMPNMSNHGMMRGGMGTGTGPAPDVGQGGMMGK